MIIFFFEGIILLCRWLGRCNQNNYNIFHCLCLSFYHSSRCIRHLFLKNTLFWAGRWICVTVLFFPWRVWSTTYQTYETHRKAMHIKNTGSSISCNNHRHGADLIFSITTFSAFYLVFLNFWRVEKTLKKLK